MFRKQLFASSALLARNAAINARPKVAMMARTAYAPMRFYSSSLSKADVEKRIINVFKSFEKIDDPSKITPKSSFTTDLGLDSLDTVEVLVAVEEEFGIEIPDNQADEIKSISDTVDYILAQPEAH